MNKAVLYARVSSKEQEKEGFSIPAQQRLLQDYAKKHNFNVIEEFIDVETAKKAGRENFSKMVKFLQKNKDVKTILVEKTDRLYRNLFDYATLEDLNVEAHLVKEGEIVSKDSNSHIKFIHGIKVLMAKNYIDNLSEESKKGMLEKAEQGIYPSRAPIGYLNVTGQDGKKVIQIDPQTAPYIKRLFEMYATGNYSLETARKQIIDEGFKYGNGTTPLYKSMVEKILKNEFYTGVFTWKGKLYENVQHEQLISRDLFAKVQKALRSPTKSKSRKGEFPYTNLIKCGLCGCYLTAEIKKNKYIYYHCSGTKGNCHQPYIRQEELEEKLAEPLRMLKISNEQANEIMQALKDIHKLKVEYHNNTMEDITKQVKKLQKRIDSIYIDKIEGNVSEEYWKEKTNLWQNEKNELLIKLSEHNAADESYLNNASVILELAKNAYSLFISATSTDKRKIVNLLYSNFLYIDGKLRVSINSPFNELISSKTIKTASNPDYKKETDVSPVSLSNKWLPR